MKRALAALRLHAQWLVALLVVLLSYSFARLEVLAPADRAEAAARFHFERMALDAVSPDLERTQRTVHPSLARISAWISAVGASVALADLDGDGLANDMCRVETRSDEVIVGSVPSTGDRYPTFTLVPVGVPYDSETTAPMGCLPGDLNEDGLEDLLVYYWGRTPLAFLRTGSRANSTLSAAHYRPSEIVDRVERWNTNAVTRADLDGDGHLDLIIGNYFQDGAAVLGRTAAAAPSMQHSMSRAFNGGRNRLLLWAEARSGSEPRVRFRDASDALSDPIQRAWTLAVGAADLDGDLLPEIYFANDFGPDRLLHNRSSAGRLRLQPIVGRKGFRTPASKVLGRDSFKGMGVDFADLNGDALLDIYVSNIAAEYALEESHFAFLSTGRPQDMWLGIAPFVDRSESLGLSRSSWGWESRWADFDNDGTLEALQATGFLKGTVDRWPELQELAMGNDQLLSKPGAWPRFEAGDEINGSVHNPFFVRIGERFHDIATSVGLGDPQVSRGIATADVDGDGDLDFAVANQWEPSYFYRNDGKAHGAYLHLDLLLPLAPGAPGPRVSSGTPVDPSGGRPAIGAVAKVSTPDGRTLVGEVDGGNGHSGARSPSLHFGLGEVEAGTLVPVALRWREPDGAEGSASLRLPPGHHTVVLSWRQNT